MKHIYTFAAVTLLLLTACNEKEEKPLDRTTSDWAFYELEGDVKSITIKSKTVSETGEPGNMKHENPTTHDTEIEFNEEGMVVLEKKLNSDGGPYEQITYNGREHKLEQIQYVKNVPGIKTEFQWDETGLNNTAITRLNSDNTQIDRKEMKYEKGRIIEKITYNKQNNPVDRMTYAYDKDGNVIEENLFLGLEKVQVKNNYKYDNNQKVAEIRYDKDNNIIFSTSFGYEGDNLVYKEVENGEGKTEYLEKMTYTENGDLKSKTIIDHFDNIETTEEYSYDANGNKTGWSVTKNGTPYIKSSYSYNENGDIVRSVIIDGEGRPVDDREYSYKYDEKGNWTEKAITVNGTPSFVEKREITYYN